MDASFFSLASPIACWFCTGCLKFLLRSIRQGGINVRDIGYGGFPSNHVSIVSCTFGTCVISHGPDNAGTVAALGLMVIVVIDALGLRNKVGALASSVNLIEGNSNHREIMGHSKFEVLGGLIFGAAFSWFYLRTIQQLFS